MFSTLKNKIILLSIILIVSLIISNNAIGMIKQDKYDYYLKIQTELLHVKHHSTERYFRIMSKDIYSMYMQNKKFIELFSKLSNASQQERKQLRSDIYNRFKRNYKRLRNMGISHISFYTPDSAPFLSMQSPSDNKTFISKGVLKVNETLEVQQGFEACNLRTGLHFMYPIYDSKKKHIGAVEISFSTKNILNNIIDDLSFDSHMLISKNIMQKATLENTSKRDYALNWESKDYYIELSTHKTQKSQDFYQDIKSEKLQEKIAKNIRMKDDFSVSTIYRKQNIVLTFLAITGLDGSKNAAYIVTYMNSGYLHGIDIEHNYLQIFFLILLILLYLFSIYVLVTRERLKSLALYDSLTQLPNRTLFLIELENELKRAQRYNTNVALMFIDLDGFKKVNDTYGHHIGDALLKEVAIILNNNIRKSNLVARLGGDEFTIVLPDIQDTQSAINIANDIISDINAPIIIEYNHIHIGASIGISLYPTDSVDHKTLIKNADKMMYKAKQNGKNQVVIFEQ